VGRWPEFRVIKPRGLAVIRAKCASREKIAAYYEELKRILQKYDLEDKSEAIYNMIFFMYSSETSAFDQPDSATV
jgi:tripartite-type tricarboxylate transporter receptor subunit TctC